MRYLFSFSSISFLFAGVLSSSLFWSSSAFALAVTGVSGSSNYSTTGTVKIYGGLAGANCSSAASSNVSTCNSCEASFLTCTTTPLCACNTARIYDGLILTINLRKNEAGSANAIVTKASDGTALNLTSVSNGGSSVSLTWFTICSAMGAGSCESVASSGTNTSITLRVVIDKDGNNANTSGEETVDVDVRVFNPGTTTYNVYGAPTTVGISDFKPYPGDEKIFLEDLNGEGGFPVLGYAGASAQFVRIFSSDVSMDDAVPGGGLETEDLPVVDNGDNLERNVFSGLTNGTTYAFRIGLVDEANNVVQFYPPDNSGTCDAVPFNNSNCKYIATPDEVLGLLTDDMNCFVATAAYGSSLEPQLKMLRAFRNKVLLPHSWGRAFVKSYYKYGPHAARFLFEHAWLKPLVRVALWPALGFSWLALKWGFTPAAILFALLSLILLLSVRLWTRGRCARA